MLRNILLGKHIRITVSGTFMLAVLVTAALSAQATWATTFRVENNGVDSATCGPAANPCRSITQAIANAAAGDKIVVGPGTYGDLDGDGTLGSSPGEEVPPTFCNCMLLINKSVTIVSSDGAAETIINATTAVNLASNVSIVASNVKFGASGAGFTVTNVNTPPQDETATNGVTTNADQVVIKGNRVVVEDNVGLPFSGIEDFGGFDGTNTVLIEGNQVIGWTQGIAAGGINETITQNTVQFSYRGIAVGGQGTIKGNVVTGNTYGFVLYGNGVDITGNAILGNQTGIDASAGGTIEKNNIYGNGCGIYLYELPQPAVLADHNYWGAATGPGSAPANTTCGINASMAVVTPFAKTPFTVTLTVTP
jgi:parallel beta-helix repeat protein